MFIFGKEGSRLKTDDANCVFRYSSNFGVSSAAGKYGSEVGRIGIFEVATA